MKNIAVLGTGTAGVTSLAHLLAWLPGDEYVVTSIYDPKIPILGIGESTTASIPEVLGYGADLNFFTDADLLDSTIKYGVKYTNWRNYTFESSLPAPHYAIHFNNFKIREVCFEKFAKKWGDKFQTLEGELTDLQNLPDKVTCKVNGKYQEFDYLIDCRGYPTDYSEYDIVDTIPVNHCLVNMIPEPGNWNFTHHQAHPNGWMFGIPLQTRQGWGYLYNDTITTKDEAISNISEIFNTPKEELNLKEFAFKNYKAKKFINGRIAVNGNRALFYEPLEALSGWFYDRVVRAFFDVVIAEKIDERTANNTLRLVAEDYELFICYVYHGGSIYDSPFWEITKEKCTRRLETSGTWNSYVEFLKRIKPEHYANPSKVMPFPYSIWRKFDEGLGYNYFSPPPK